MLNKQGEGTSSNYREFRNLVETLEGIGSKKGLDRREVFLCTYNMFYDTISEAGSYRAETLYDLAVQLHFFCMRYRCQVIFIHVSCMRMIGQETYGLSRGSFVRGGL